MNATAIRWLKYLAAIILGNIVYFKLLPWLPAGARHNQLLDWGTFVDLWFCVFFYGLIEACVFLIQSRRARRD